MVQDVSVGKTWVLFWACVDLQLAEVTDFSPLCASCVFPYGQQETALMAITSGGVILISKGGEANTRYRWKETINYSCFCSAFFFFIFQDK